MSVTLQQGKEEQRRRHSFASAEVAHFTFVKSMSAVRLAVAISLLSFGVTSKAQSPLQPPKKEDVIGLVYEFVLTADGKPYDIKFWQALWQRDRSDASGAITDLEKERGAALLSTHQYHPRPDQVGTKRYDFVLFDTKSGSFDRGTRPQDSIESRERPDQATGLGK